MAIDKIGQADFWSLKPTIHKILIWFGDMHL